MLKHRHRPNHAGATDDGRLVTEDDRARGRPLQVRSDVLVDDDGRAVGTPLPPEPRRAEEVTTERTASVGQFVIMLAGAALLALGIVAVVRTDLNGSLSEPVADVLGFAHTPLLGLFEIGAGVLLLLAGLRPAGRWFAGLIGALLVVAGTLILAELAWTRDELGTEQSLGWVPIIIGGVVLLAAFVLPTRVRRVTEIR
jgi:hypothetical protein